MKIRTHVVFGIGVASLVLAALNRYLSIGPCALPLLLASAAMHPVIDMLSHKLSSGYRVRTRLLHSFETVVLVSAALGAISGYLAGGPGCIVVGVTAFIASGSSHLLLDALTPGGVWVFGRKVSVPLGRWDDPFLNTAASLAGLSMLVVAALEVLSP